MTEPVRLTQEMAMELHRLAWPAARALRIYLEYEEHCGADNDQGMSLFPTRMLLRLRERIDAMGLRGHVMVVGEQEDRIDRAISVLVKAVDRIATVSHMDDPTPREAYVRCDQRSVDALSLAVRLIDDLIVHNY